VLSSPQRRATQTAEPVAATRELALKIDDRFAEHNRDLPVSRFGQATVVTVNGTEHVWDLLPRNQRW
jgi:phosphohistidine phosphatase SixA